MAMSDVKMCGSVMAMFVTHEGLVVLASWLVFVLVVVRVVEVRFVFY